MSDADVPDVEEVQELQRSLSRKATRLTILSLVCGAIGVGFAQLSDAITATFFLGVLGLGVGLGARLKAFEAGRPGRLALVGAALGLAVLVLGGIKLFSFVDEARKLRPDATSSTTGP